MELKLKEKLNLDSLTVNKRILDSTIELMEGKVNYTDNDIKFYLMITFLNELVDGDVIVYCLADESKLEEKLINEIEPFFNNNLSENLKFLYHNLYLELKDYLEREFKIKTSVSGTINKAIEILASLDYSDLYNGVINHLSNKEETPTKKILSKEEGTIENEKMKDLINKFTKEQNATNE